MNIVIELVEHVIALWRSYMEVYLVNLEAETFRLLSRLAHEVLNL